MKNLVFVLVLVLVVVVLEVSCAPSEQEESVVQTSQVEPYEGGSIDEGGKALQALDAYLQSVTTTTVVKAQPPVTYAVVESAPSGDVWDDLAFCETRGNWAANTGNGFGGGLQFAHSASWSTWRAFGGQEFSNHPWEASRDQQVVVAERVLNSSGWNAWPGCARKLGLR